MASGSLACRGCSWVKALIPEDTQQEAPQGEVPKESIQARKFLLTLLSLTVWIEQAVQAQVTEKMLALNVYVLLWVFGCIHFIDAETITASLTRGGPADTTATPRITAGVTAGIISSPSPVPAGQHHSSASNVLTLITPTPRPSKQTTTGHLSGPPDGKSKSASTSAAVGASKQVTSTTIASDWSTGPSLPDPAPTEEKSALTMAAFGVISFIVILVVVVIVLASVVSLRFKCNRSKDAEDKQKPGSSVVSESSCSPATAKDSITLISMKNLSMNNSTSYPSSEKVL
ncbi:endothelial cell-specific chemotaxis regulator isoform X1 [Mauremys reevesii]|uniref:endothelial cell-specific chemotaxis regulator isoform X1 n=1 Tax=Mauremys reevesii TaxID=260615 RepID=UPI00193F796F|nr:endothelial cell-specific chemotaxis regulator isoform X1 [Mauremys reevesii]